MRTFALKTLLFWTVVCVGFAGSFPRPASAQGVSVAPTLIPVSGRLLTAEGQPRTGTIPLVISLYDGQSDASPRWIEQQTVTLDASGGYSLQVGATLPAGLPGELFGAGAGARWLGVAVQGEAEQPRVMLVSVPYAAKAASAATLDGKSASEFVLSSTFREDLRTVLEEEGVTGAGDDVSAAGTANVIQKGSGGAGVTDATDFVEVGGNVGIGNGTPDHKLEVSGVVEANHQAGIKNYQIQIGTLSPGGGATVGFQADLRPAASSNEVANSLAQRGWAMTAWGGDMFMSSNRQSTAVGGRFSPIAAANTNLFIRGADGRVGIGTINPEQNLEVNGVIESNFGGPYSGYQTQIGTLTPGGVAALGFHVDLRPSSGGVNEVANTLDQRGWAMTAAWGDFYLSRNHASTAGTRFSPFASGSIGLYVRGLDGSVGIGTNQPLAKLHVEGGARITGDVTVVGNIAAKYQDVAEWVDSAEPLDAGSLVVIDASATNRVKAARTAYDGRVAGAISPQPGLILGEAGPGKVLVAQSGRVKVKADARNGAIRPGDLLVSSPTLGHVMRSRPVKMGGHYVHRPGTVVGKALEALPKGKGEILVLLTLQ